MKKMCPRWIKPNMLGDMNMAGVCVNNIIDKSVCPKNTNSRCEIITPKKKVKKVSMRGWMNVAPTKIARKGLESGYHHRIYSDRLGAQGDALHGYIQVPCTITYTARRKK